jgi:outer membrane protein TolC
VLAAEGPWLLQRRQSAELQGRSLIAQAQSLQALGGGWQESSDTPLALTPEASRPASALPQAH